MPQMIINCTVEEHRDFLEIARQCGASPSSLGQHAMRQIISTVRAGQWPVIATDDGPRTVELMPEPPKYQSLKERQAERQRECDAAEGPKEPRISFNCTEELKDAFYQLAHSSKTSITALGQLALRQLVAASRAGAKPMIAASDGRNAPQLMDSFSSGPEDFQ